MRDSTSRDWIALSAESLRPDVLSSWATRPDCGAVVSFCGTARTTSNGRDDIVALEYETSSEIATTRLHQLVALTRTRWPDLGAIAIHHRVGRVEVGQAAVVVVVSSAHRDEAFLAARFCIDSLKKTLPMWKREWWATGSAWSEQCEEIVDLDQL